MWNYQTKKNESFVFNDFFFYKFYYKLFVVIETKHFARIINIDLNRRLEDNQNSKIKFWSILLSQITPCLMWEKNRINHQIIDHNVRSTTYLVCSLRLTPRMTNKLCRHRRKQIKKRKKEQKKYYTFNLKEINILQPFLEPNTNSTHEHRKSNKTNTLSVNTQNNRKKNTHKHTYTDFDFFFWFWFEFYSQLRQISITKSHLAI